MKFICRNLEFYCKGYYVDVFGKNMQKLKAHIGNQLRGDKLGGTATESPFKE